MVIFFSQFPPLVRPQPCMAKLRNLTYIGYGRYRNLLHSVINPHWPLGFHGHFLADLQLDLFHIYVNWENECWGNLGKLFAGFQDG
jgi:hypothetical protein